MRLFDVVVVVTVLARKVLATDELQTDYNNLRNEASLQALAVQESVQLGPQGCVKLTQKPDTRSCQFETKCVGQDISTFEFAFNCQGTDGRIFRHSFGEGGFEEQETFDSEIECARCLPPTPQEQGVVPTPPQLQPKPQKEATTAKKAVPKGRGKRRLSLMARSSRSHRKAAGRTIKRHYPKEKETHDWEPCEDAKYEHDFETQVPAEALPGSTVTFGPNNCVTLYRSVDRTCVMKTNCDPNQLTGYDFGLTCVNKDGSPVVHLFGEAAFGPKESFDTLITCDSCLPPLQSNMALTLPSADPQNPPVQVKIVPVMQRSAPMLSEPPQSPAPAPAQAPGGQPGSDMFKPEVKELEKVDQELPHEAAAGLRKLENPNGIAKETGETPVENLVNQVVPGLVPTVPPNQLQPVDADSVVFYGPSRCVGVYKAQNGHCVVQTKCANTNTKQYNFGMICKQPDGSMAKHEFGEDSFDKEETFDTLLKCDDCLGLEEEEAKKEGDPEEVKKLEAEMSDMKSMMGTMMQNMQNLQAELAASRGANAAPAPAGSAQATVLAAHRVVHRKTSASATEDADTEDEAEDNPASPPTRLRGRKASLAARDEAAAAEKSDSEGSQSEDTQEDSGASVTARLREGKKRLLAINSNLDTNEDEEASAESELDDAVDVEVNQDSEEDEQ
eukprot:TRINITY_DN3903_c0_g1_i1.p1 TRINITY_DN3903_c0_g1~~TRINITY_DN3903_c0_g1_i1.p1  ORF type:complete len:672 (-),score=192.22 TRINITY_DN3903_c0_g1_i1:8-2023(-)